MQVGCGVAMVVEPVVGSGVDGRGSGVGPGTAEHCAVGCRTPVIASGIGLASLELTA